MVPCMWFLGTPAVQQDDRTSRMRLTSLILAMASGPRQAQHGLQTKKQRLAAPLCVTQAAL